MFSVFHKENGESKFKTILLNGEKDIFVKNSLISMGWVKEDIVSYFYSSDKMIDFKNWLNDENKINELRVDPVSFDLQKIIKTKQKVIKQEISFEDVKALTFYTQQEIDDFLENEAIDAQWILDNPNVDENTLPPVYLKDWPIHQFKDVVVPESFEILDTIEGVLVDVSARIILEDAAIAAKKNKLD